MTSLAAAPLQARISFVRRLVESLFTRFEETVEAVVADGWPEAMVRRGFMLHRRTWDVDALCEALEQELRGVGGVGALERFSDAGGTATLSSRVFPPRAMVHLWPALPGAGLSPVLFGWLLGARQIVRPSSRGTYFAQLLLERCRELDHQGRPMLELELGALDKRWKELDAVIASGSDETLLMLREFLDHPPHRGRPTLLGYGHRVSFGVVVDDGTPQAFEIARDFATDIVMWHQLGCFSARAMIFCGPHQRARQFAAALGAAIAEAERALDARQLDEATLARRAQARGVAELLGTLHGDGVGWVQLANSPWYGDTVSAHTVTLHTLSSLGELHHALKVPPHQLQGVALHAPPQARAAWREALARRGVTRICAPGALQSPHAGWMHDSIPNTLDLLRIVRSE